MAIDTAPPRQTQWRRRRPMPQLDEPRRVTMSDEPDTGTVIEQGKPIPMHSMLASAKRITNETISRVGAIKEAGWQSDAIDLYRLIGEERFLVTTLAGRVGAGRLYAGKIGTDITAKPEMCKPEDKAAQILEALGETQAGRAQLVARQSLNLQVTGDGWIVGIPEDLLERAEKLRDPTAELSPDGKETDINIETLKWFQLSVKEVTSAKNSTKVVLRVNGKKLKVEPDQVWMVRCWNPDPFDAEAADSPARSSLPVLRELLGLTQYVSAQIDSRLAGAGVFIIPQSAKDAIIAELGEDYDGEADVFVELLMEAMMTAISDRSSAASMVPVCLTVPDAVAGSDFWHHISFATPLDKEARALREEAIRRLALGQDVPPEVLLGVGSMNHWGAWLVREDTITTHVEPQLALICDALTTQYLWPILEQQGMSEDDYQKYVIWYDVDHLITRPNKLEDGVVLHQEGVISDSALRDSGGYTDEDAPGDVETTDDAARIVLDMVKQNASLLRNPGVDVLLENIRALLKGGKGTTPSKEIAIPEQPQDEVVQGELVDETGPPSRTPAPIAASGAEVVERPIWNINVNVEPQDAHYTIEMPEGFVASAPPAPVQVDVHVPEQKPPTVENNVFVEPTPVNVEVPTQPVPDVKVQVDVPTQPVPDVKVENKAPDVNPTPVTVQNEVKVEAPKPRRRRTKVRRNNQGLIDELETTE